MDFLSTDQRCREDRRRTGDLPVISEDDASFAPLCTTPLRRLGEPYGHIDLRPCPLVRYVLTLALLLNDICYCQLEFGLD